MKNKLKLITAAIGFAVASGTSFAQLPFPDPIEACVLEGMANYCKSTGQDPNCAVPTHIYYEIRQSCY